MTLCICTRCVHTALVHTLSASCSILPTWEPYRAHVSGRIQHTALKNTHLCSGTQNSCKYIGARIYSTVAWHLNGCENRHVLMYMMCFRWTLLFDNTAALENSRCCFNVCGRLSGNDCLSPLAVSLVGTYIAVYFFIVTAHTLSRSLCHSFLKSKRRSR